MYLIDAFCPLSITKSSQHLPPGLEKHSIIGDICYLGRTSLWMNGATNTEHEVAMGPFRPSAFGCTLYAGQRSRRCLTRTDQSAVSSYHVSNCSVGPPHFTPFFFNSFLSLSSSSNADCEWQLINRQGNNSPANGINNELARYHIKSTLRQVNSLGSTSSALRIIVMKVVSMLYDSKTSSEVGVDSVDSESPSEETLVCMQTWAAGKAILAEVVSVVKEIYDPLGFATFFLSIGRQLEPHQFNLIFPLPGGSGSGVLPAETTTSDSPPISTAEDLFALSCDHGSLATAVSALPLFACHEVSQQSVSKLVYHCLIKVEENFVSCSSPSCPTFGEDELFIHQLFWFGVKLEDALEIEKSHVIEDDDDDHVRDNSIASSQSSIVSSSHSNFEESSIDEDSDDEFIDVSTSYDTSQQDYTFDTYSSEESNEVSFISSCRTPRQKKAPRVGIIKKVVKKLFPSASPSENNDTSQQVEESAIHDAASSFILSGFGNMSPVKSTPLSEVPLEDNDVKSEPEVVDHNTPDIPTFSTTTVAGTVCLFINHIMISRMVDNAPNYGWKIMSVIAHLLQGDRETAVITSAASSNAQRISSMLILQDFNAAFNDSGDTDNTVADHLVNLTLTCRQQINSQAFGFVFNLILLILLRHNTCHDVQLCKGTLVAIGIVSGHLSGRISEILDPADRACAYQIYSVYISQLTTTSKSTDMSL